MIEIKPNFKQKRIREIYYQSTKLSVWEIMVIFFEGLSFTSKLIKWFTRSRFSHVGFYLNDDCLVEAWTDTRYLKFPKSILGIFGAGWQLTTMRYHTVNTPYTILTKRVDFNTYVNYLQILDFVATARLPYDFKEIAMFVFKGKESRPNGKFVCSTGTAFILQHVNVIPQEIPYWRLSPEDLYEVLIANGFRTKGKGVVVV